MKDAKTEVIERLLALARVIRRKGSPDEATAAVDYERQFVADLEKRNAELAQMPEKVAA